jgi:exopolysaccharide production protein ExoZ
MHRVSTIADEIRRRFELSRGDAHNVRAMEGLRGLAVFLVFFVHFGSQVAVYLPAHSATARVGDALATMGNAGVDLFFVLSGYLIYGKLISRPQPFLTFARRRLERIYPTFVAVFALYLLFSFLRPSEDKIPDSFLHGAGYLLANFFLLPGLFPIGNMITQAWSLSYEIFFYLLIPLLIVATGMRAWRPLTRILLFLVIAAGFTTYCCIQGGHVRLIMFVAGIVLYEVIRYRLFPAVPGILAVAATAGGLGLLLMPLTGATGFSLKICGLFVCFFLLCHVCFTGPNALITQAMRWTPIRWLGNMSYSYYLVHGLALKAFFVALAVIIPTTVHSPALYWVLLPVAFAVTLVPSVVLFLTVERPLSLSPALEKRAERETGGLEPAIEPTQG